MADTPRRSDDPGRPDQGPPVEIPMTDLEAGAAADHDRVEPRGGGGAGDIFAAGTPGGGTASGGLAGTNVGDGSPDNADLEGALGSGAFDTGGEADPNEPPGGYGGISGGAVGGTPAEGRAKGGHSRRGLAPGPHRGDSTVGADPDARRSAP